VFSLPVSLLSFRLVTIRGSGGNHRDASETNAHRAEREGEAPAEPHLSFDVA